MEKGLFILNLFIILFSALPRRICLPIGTISKSVYHLFWPRHKETCLPGYANNKGTDQLAHSRSLISAIVVCLLESIISRLGRSHISLFKLVSVVKETGSSLALFEILKTGFVASRPIYPLTKLEGYSIGIDRVPFIFSPSGTIS